MSNIFDTEPTMSTLTYQEKSLYGVLIAEFAVFIPYFIRAAHGHTSLVRVSGLFFLVTIVQIVIQGIIGAVSRNRIKDERDRLIEARGFRAAYFALVTGIIFTFILLWTAPSFCSILLINVL